MATAQTHDTGGFSRLRYAFLAAAAALVLLGLVGLSHAAIGYALFLLATLMLAAGLGLLGIFALTGAFDANALRRGYGTAFWMGGWTYVFAVAALSGYYLFEALSGRVELRYILFGPAILAALLVLDIGIYNVIVKRNLPTIRRFGDLWSRDALDHAAMRQTLIDEVVLHRTLLTVHPFRWLRHQLIFWGFGLMFAIEMIAVAFREAFPAFGWTGLWYDTGHPVRITFDLAFEITGLMILLGCILALIYRVIVNGKQNQRFTDTPTTIFLFVVVVTGFLEESARLAHIDPDASGMWASFLGRALVPVSPTTAAGEQAIWIVHVLAACAFISYIPLKRMIHSCATPVGRLVNSQHGLLAARKKRVVDGLARRWM